MSFWEDLVDLYLLIDQIVIEEGLNYEMGDFHGYSKTFDAIKVDLKLNKFPTLPSKMATLMQF